jgi:hypothetical protein
VSVALEVLGHLRLLKSSVLVMGAELVFQERAVPQPEALERDSQVLLEAE